MRLSAWIYWKWTKLHRWIRNSKEMQSWMIYFSSFFLFFCLCNMNRMKPKNCKRVFHFFHIHKMNKNQIPSFILCSFYLFFLTDVDECKTYLNKCHVNATCNNTNGSHVCTCKPGYTGDGRNCTGTINNLRSFHIRFDYYNNFCLLLLFLLFVCLFVCFNTVESQDLIFVT